MTKLKSGLFEAKDLVSYSDEKLIAEARGDQEQIDWYYRMSECMKERYPEEDNFSKWQVWRVWNALTSN